MVDIMEILFDVSYLAIIWYVVYNMFTLLKEQKEPTVILKKTLAWAFALLALGDTFHVGFRVVAYFSGGTVANPALLGYGKLATAITVTMFYALMVRAWRLRFRKDHTVFSYLLLFGALVRMIVILLPGNNWASANVPFNWSMYRNLPLLVTGLGVAYLFLKDGKKANDHLFPKIGIAILVSYAFYTPVILFAQYYPLLGLLMIPKTIAYLVAAFLAYRTFTDTKKADL